MARTKDPVQGTAGDVQLLPAPGAADRLDQRIHGGAVDTGDVQGSGPLSGLGAVNHAQPVSRGEGADEIPARHVEIVLLNPALVLRRIDDSRKGLDAEPLQIVLEGLRMRLERGLEIEELDPEGLAVRQLEDAAFPLAARLPQQLVRPP